MRKKYRPKTKQDLRKLILNEEIELADIDTSRITDMSHLFEPTLRGGDQSRFFFDGIETWDVSNVTDMSYMFCYAKNFNEPLNSWNVSKVRNMRGMFQFASSFNQPLDKWDVSKVENMSSMFYDAAAFSQNLDSWNVSNVKTMRFMFMYARYFKNKPVWNVDHVEDVVGMYYGTPIVYVDPDLACGIDPELEKLAAKESLDSQLNSVLDNDGIARFAQDFVNKTHEIASTVGSAIERKAENRTSETVHDSNVSSQEKTAEKNMPADDSKTVEITSEENGPKVKRLKDLLDRGLITQDEYDLLVKENSRDLCIYSK